MKKLIFAVLLSGIIGCKPSRNNPNVKIDSVSASSSSDTPKPNTKVLVNKDSLAIDKKVSELAKPVYVKTLAEVYRIRQDLKLALDGDLDREGALKEFNETFGPYMGRYKSVESAEKRLDSSGEEFAKMLFYKEKARIAYKLAAEVNANNL